MMFNLVSPLVGDLMNVYMVYIATSFEVRGVCETQSAHCGSNRIEIGI